MSSTAKDFMSNPVLNLSLSTLLTVTGYLHMQARSQLDKNTENIQSVRVQLAEQASVKEEVIKLREELSALRRDLMKLIIKSERSFND